VEAMQHPTWNMGAKITIDSATLMNKGLEVIEARWLFGFGPDQIDILVHPESVVHSMVEMVDGSVIAQMGVTDMRHPIQYALTYPDRQAGCLPALDLTSIGSLDFEQPDSGRFPCLELAYDALKMGGTMPAILNAANQIRSYMIYVLTIAFYYVLIPLTVLGIAVNIHEFGHFMIAKFFGMRVEAYSFFGLGPRIWGFKRGHTDYRISAIPLGAYVKLYGDEATSSLEGGSSEAPKFEPIAAKFAIIEE